MRPPLYTRPLRWAWWARTAVQVHLCALVRRELAIDNGSFSPPAGWQIAGVAPGDLALDCSALEYVIDGDKEFPRPGGRARPGRGG